MPSRCPACQEWLKEIKVSGVSVDVCLEGCGGVWFDLFEIQKFDEAHERSGDILAGLLPREPAPADRAAKRRCPKCCGVPMMRRLYCPTSLVVVDECPGCGGFWLDAGELAAIRAEYDTEVERRAAAEMYIVLLVRSQLKAMAKKSAAEAVKALRIARALCFLCPSYYFPRGIPGGAFSAAKPKPR